jgi:hypothetical protein
MNLTYLKDKPFSTQVMWELMEEYQDYNPRYWLGWDEFVLMVVWV